MHGGVGQLKPVIWFLAVGLLLAGGQGNAEPALRQKGEYTWAPSEQWFGGVSGIEVSATGDSAVFITDSGRMIQADFVRQDGRITDIRFDGATRLRNTNGSVLKGDGRDSEGLAISWGGAAFVSLEFRDRVAALSLKTGRIENLPEHPDFSRFRSNRGIEALAIDRFGHLFALAEGFVSESGNALIYRFDGQRWTTPYELALRGPYLPVGADFGPDEALYVLERAVTPLGFSSRIRRLHLSEGQARAETLLTTLPAAYDNLEGIAAWRDTDGHIRLTLVSDDNFLPIQRTQIVEFAVIE